MHLPPLDVAVYPIVTMHHGSSFRRSTPAQPPAPRSCPDFASIQKLVRQVLRSSRITVQQVERLRGNLHRLHLLRMTDGTQLVLKAAPFPTVRSLRHEQRILENESRILDLVAAHTTVPVARVISHDPQGGSFHSPYLLRSHVAGTPLTEMYPYLTSMDRARIDATIGLHMQALSSLSAPSFGPTHRVFAGSGYGSWREAFVSLLESVLRDAEDMLVSIPYDLIRFHVARHGHLLEQVKEARLVALDVGLPPNVLIDEQSKRVAGLLGFGNVVWGDPLMAAVFSGASEAFFEGYGQCMPRTERENVKQLLYSLYRAIVAVVVHYCRHQPGSEELEARRSLTWALNQLAAMR